ncbi:carbohydrate ABC transporter permease [Solimicrobium silvestre]|uniref:ABC-type sugar transport system permease component n=1 Tax=Solimicrobium silvestre TaxID=2099400 RepID=A0A2S9H3W0_9BURK|nr:carbohydrate ABC transporter permease [Solimicrobium silvestre]PRC94657.1 ABC-type sugar transport system permease component [Solimicrobium silvestre]
MNKRKTNALLLNSLTWAVVVLSLLPIFWMVLSSLRNYSDIADGDQLDAGLPLQWQNYIDMWVNVDFFNFFKNSLIVCSITTLLATLSATCAAYALARFRFRGSNTVSVGITVTQVIPGMLFFLPLYMLYRQVGESWGIPMLDTYHGLIFLYVALFTPASIWIMRGFFISIPRELEDAAIIDGCSRFGAFVRIVLPISAPGIIATATFIFLLAWDELFFAWTLTSSSSVQTIPVGIRLFIGQYQHRYDLMMAAATVSTVPVLIAFFACQRFFIKGLAAGAVKG